MFRKLLFTLSFLLILPAAAQVTITPPAVSRPGETINVRDYGARLDGTTDDTASMQAARGAATTDGVVFVPAGGWVTSSPLTSGPALGRVLWRLTGNKFGVGTTPVTSVGDDTIESVLNGGKYFSRASSTAQAPTVRVDGLFNGVTTGTPSGAVVNTVGINTVIPAPVTSTSFAANYVWGFGSTMIDSHIGAAQNVATQSSVFRPSTALADGFGIRGPIWAFYAEANDNTNQPSNVSGSLVGFELGMYANGADPGTAGDGGDRNVLQIAIGKSNAAGSVARIGHGISLGSNDAGAVASRSFMGIPIGVNLAWDVAGIDLSKGASLSSAPAVRLGSNMTLDLSGDSAHTLYYDAGTGCFTFKGSGAVVRGLICDSGAYAFGPWTLNASGIGAILGTSLAVGIDTTGATISTAALRISGGQAIAFEATAAALMTYTSNAFRLKFSGADVFTADQSGNGAVPGTMKVGNVVFASLPTVGTAGRMIFCSNCRKPGEGAGVGTGMLVFDDGVHWVSTAGTTAAN